MSDLIEAVDPRIGKILDGKLEILDVLGRGGMGVVYRARQLSMDRDVAVKVLHGQAVADQESVQRFLHEAKVASRLRHPNVITVFDFGQTEDGLLYLVMELLEGTELSKVLDEERRLAPARVVHLMTQVCDAVQHAHDAGLIHRDLKPENIFLMAGSNLRADFVKVLDFGIARAQEVEGSERLTRTGTLCGTPAYMSPEQILGDKLDARSDIYSLGVML
ncbi:MAG: serine/threonine protein kinase, partial [Myxococcales bacterium]|nr:serine/threonine protein kinase [Myxococcales bacterium]